MGQEGSKDSEGMPDESQVQSGANNQNQKSVNSKQKNNNGKTKDSVAQKGNNERTNADGQIQGASGTVKTVPVDADGQKLPMSHDFEKELRRGEGIRSDKVMNCNASEIVRKPNEMEQKLLAEAESVNTETQLATAITGIASDHDGRLLQGTSEKRNIDKGDETSTRTAKQIHGKAGTLDTEQLFLTHPPDASIVNKSYQNFPSSPQFYAITPTNEGSGTTQRQIGFSDKYVGYKLGGDNPLPKSDTERRLESHSKKVAALLKKPPVNVRQSGDNGHPGASVKTDGCQLRTYETVEYNTEYQTQRISDTSSQVCRISVSVDQIKNIQ